MPKYVLSEAAFINNHRHEAGDVVETDLPPGPHMEPHKDEKGHEDREARKAKDAAGETASPAPGDPKFIGDLINHNVAGGGETNGRVNVAGGLTQQTVPGLRVDAHGQVRGVTNDVGTGDAGDGKNAVGDDGEVGKPAKRSKE